MPQLLLRKYFLQSNSFSAKCYCNCKQCLTRLELWKCVFIPNLHQSQLQAAVVTAITVYQLSHQPNPASAAVRTVQHSNAFRVKLSLSPQTHRFQEQLETGSCHVSFNRRISISQVVVLSGDDASECVEWQRESFVHVLAQPRVVLLAQTVFGLHRLLDAVAGVQAWGHLDAAKSHVGTVSHHEWVNFHTKVFLDSLGMV